MIIKKRVIIVEDHDLFREGMRTLLNSSETIEVIGEASNGKDFLDIVRDLNPDVVLMDISMPVMDGLEATTLAISDNPGTKVIALSMYDDEENYVKMINAGIRGFILKSAGIKEIEKAVIEVSNNKNYFPNELLPILVNKTNPHTVNNEMKIQDVLSFSKSEIDVMKLILVGLSNEDIAFNNKISIQEVTSTRTKILRKMYCRDSCNLGIYIIKNNLAEVAELQYS